MDQESSWKEEETVALEMTSDMQGMMWGEPELSGLLTLDNVKVSFIATVYQCKCTC